MQAHEIRGAGNLLGDLAGEMTDRVEELHSAISSRAFANTPGSAPVRIVHDGIAGSLYSAARGAGRVAGRAGGMLLASRAPADAPALLDAPRGGATVAAIVGIIGDRLEADGNGLAMPMSVRHRGRDVSPAQLAREIEPTGRLAVFVHGLCESELSWAMFRQAHGGRTYASRLSGELSYTSLHLRYNSGLHISDNGRRLAQLMEEVVATWPVEVREIAFIGHSMGGLVARSACHRGREDDSVWVESVRQLIYLSAPHMGADLEKATNRAGWALNKLGETRPIARFLELRSAGIKDLRHGAVVDDDWHGIDPDALLGDRCTDVPLLEGADHYVVSAQLADPWGAGVGDLLVKSASASGRGRTRTIAFEEDNGRHFPGVNHFQLLNHPQVYEQMRQWLAPRLLPAPGATA